MRLRLWHGGARRPGDVLHLCKRAVCVVTEQASMWIKDQYHGPSRVALTSKPEGSIGWDTSQVPLIGELKASHVYVVIVQYSTGSSFGTDTGLTTTALVATTAEMAIKAKKAIEENASKDKPSYSFQFEGIELDCGTWTGYFESVEDVRIELTAVGP